MTHDPDALLESIRRACRSIISQAESKRQHHETTTNPEAELACALAEKIKQLDEWLRKGGLLPVEWSDPRV